MISNEEKRDVYAKLKIRLKKAISSGFWLEACMIEYAIMEDRTSSILFHAGITENAWSPSKKMGNKLNSIEYQIGKKHPVISQKVSAENIKAIKSWKDRRNTAVHRACTMTYDEDFFQALAEEGKTLSDRLDNDSRKVANYIKRQ